MRRINGDRRFPSLPARHDKIRIPLWWVVVGMLGRLAGRCLLVVLRHPVAVGALVILTAFYRQTGLLGLGALAAFVVLVSGAWRLAHRASFDRAAWWTWGRLRLVAVYRRKWRPATLHCGLAIQIPASNAETVSFDEYFPRIRGFRASVAVESLRVELLPGQTPEQWAEQAEALRHVYRARACRVRCDQVGFIWLDFYRRDPLDRPVPPADVDGPDGPDGLDHLPIGRREDGGPWLLPLRGSHVLVAGATGSGKGSVLWSLIRALGPAVAAGLVELWVCDPKGGMEMAAGARLFARFAYDLPSIADLLDDAVARMQSRADGLRGVARLHTPTVGDPLIVVLVDEIAALTAYVTDRDLKRRLSASLGLLLSQGRAPGVVVVAAVQDPRKETLPFRDLFPVRVALRLVEAEQVDLVLGAGAHDKGARCQDIPPNLQGTGYVAEDGGGDPVRVRASWPDDAEIRRTIDRYSAPAAGALAVLRPVPPRLELPGPTIAPEIADILRARGMGHLLGLDGPARRRRVAWPWRKAEVPRSRPGWPAAGWVPDTDRPVDGWVPDLAEYGDPWAEK
ncbi:FtsK/SpoIIIE domain-containing protein [Pseudofrankia inefficax]|uniref:Cell division protein FtsK/SpoIIIE n=1 Tax=Pseudofrankia inefficax (strain DSM 45817 / CECT 9037 / DDB 130130 / EuI1c) TaxID=298654 RepID=E3J271_PSEI1|nr:FtsK/SpoIIIE domain-containing protein [Pseudofrankia inefficax]ADP78109.1 cell division protein FtsK/SpoIIIE [Pseudofrankia inefficax]